jgi:hypothetical protein
VSLAWEGTNQQEVSLASDTDLDTGGLVLDSNNSPAMVVIDGLSSERTIALAAGSGKGTLITVGNGVTLVLRNVTFKGMDDDNAPLIRVNGGTLIMESGALLTGNKRNDVDGYGGGVYILDNYFTKTGGTIYGEGASSELKNEEVGIYAVGGQGYWRITTAWPGINLHYPLIGEPTDSNWE